MITEDYVSYEIAKLLKEKGFDEHSQIKFCQIAGDEIYAIKGHGQITIDRVYIPTHQMAMKWLREKDIDIIIMPLFKFKEGRIYCYEIHSDNTDVRVGRFETYEEAVEAAIKYSLENLI